MWRRITLSMLLVCGLATGVVVADPGDDTCDLALPLPLPGVVPMNVQPGGDHNWVSFEVLGPEPVTVRIETLTDLPGTGTDNTDLTLWRDCLGGLPVDEIAFNDDSSLANDFFMSRIDTYCLSPGQYWVEVGGAFDFQQADNILLEVDVSDVCRPLEPGCGEHGLLTAPCDGRCSGGGSYCGGGVSGGRSVYLFSGEFYEEVVDLTIPGRGLDFVWARKYRSKFGPSDEFLGNGWDHSYNIRIFPIDVQPGEVENLIFTDKDTLIWNPPTNPGGPPVGLLYCTLRSAQATGFDNGGITSIIDPDGPDLLTVDPSTPGPGEVNFFLVSAKNGFREGTLGHVSSGAERQGLSCGVRGPDLLLDDGNTRRDVYQVQPDGVWTAPEFFRTFEQEGDGSFTLRFTDTGRFEFHPFDGSPQAGMIRAIADRNGNMLSFTYDDQGKLATVTDTLDRDIVVAYNGNGLVDTVTDFAGRQVKYDYYEDVDAGGSFADLKSVTTPAVVGTPHGNDFPGGKTTVYSYSEGFADDRLNHNLLTITDPRGQTYLVNEYSPTLDPGSVDFDRVVRQVWGDVGDRLDFVYVPILPDPVGDFAVIKAILNDRAGNVEESRFDPANRCVSRQDLTGRADPDQPTTEVLNRPAAPLRFDDPATFDTTFQYDADSLPLVSVRPNANVLQVGYDALNPDRLSQANPLLVCRLPGGLGGDQPQICETFEYNPTFNLVDRHVDARGNETLHTYDGAGNRTHTDHRIPLILEDWEYNVFGQVTAHVLPDNGSGHRRRDGYTYYVAGPQRGYPESEIVDEGGFDLTTTYAYDLVGNVTRITDPRASDQQYTFNSLDQVVVEKTREVDGGGTRYEKLTLYDSNDNVVRVDVENIDDQGVLQPNTHFTTVYEYDILNYVTRTCAEHGSFNGPLPDADSVGCGDLPAPDSILTEFEYDDNRNQTLLRRGEAANGSQPANTVTTLFDERDLVYRRIRADGDAEQSTSQLDYDSNGNRKRSSSGLEGTPRMTTYAYDGYDRLTRTTDPLGNASDYHYDPNSNDVSRRLDGELIDIAGDAGNLRLYEVTYEYDNMDRMTREIVDHFDTASQTPVGDGQATTDLEYSLNSQIITVTDDNGNAKTTTYDSANRPLTVTDAKSNSVTYDYDANSNVTGISETERSDLGNPDQVFVTGREYDGLDRLIARTDNVGNRITYFYDSRDNQTRKEDSLRLLPLDPGNITTYEYDGINRMTRTIYNLTSDGTGAGAPAGSIVTELDWDDSLRLVGARDDNGNLTQYAYDSLDRRTSVQLEDLTSHAYVYDVHGNQQARTDANGTQIQQTFDLRDRLTGRTIVLGPGVGGTTSETYAYDGASRAVRAQDDDSLVLRSYDSLSYVTLENQNGQEVACVHDGVGNKLNTFYPNGRVVTNFYDALNRISFVADELDPIAFYDYIGPRRVEQRGYINSRNLTFEYDGVANAPGDFGVKRPVRATHQTAGGGFIVDDRAYAWDRMYNKSRREDLRAGGLMVGEDYSYDSVFRLVESVETPPGPSLGSVSYTLDGVGNRTLVIGSLGGLYTMDPTLPGPGDSQVNQYTTTPLGPRTHDDNGNHTGDGVFQTRAYDYRNQMVEFIDTLTGVTATYAYDAMGRRIQRDEAGPIPFPGTTRYVYDGWQLIEEQDAEEFVQRSYVYGNYVNEVLNMRFDAASGEYFFYHEDEQSSVMAITDAFGTVVERYDYDDYGRPTDDLGAPKTSSGILNPFLFSGAYYDFSTGLYYMRSRYFDPLAGRFTSRDPLDDTYDLTFFAGRNTAAAPMLDYPRMGNAYTYSGNNSPSWTDPSGRATADANPPDPHPGPDRGGRVSDQELEKLKQKFKEKFGRGWGVPPPPGWTPPKPPAFPWEVDLGPQSEPEPAPAPQPEIKPLDLEPAFPVGPGTPTYEYDNMNRMTRETQSFTNPPTAAPRAPAPAPAPSNTMFNSFSSNDPARSMVVPFAGRLPSVMEELKWESPLILIRGGTMDPDSFDSWGHSWTVPNGPTFFPRYK